MDTDDLFFVGFYSRSEPGCVQRWRPKMHSPEVVAHAKALRRWAKLERKMMAGKKIDGLYAESIALFRADGTAIRAKTKDGMEPEARPEDFLSPMRGDMKRGQA